MRKRNDIGLRVNMPTRINKKQSWITNKLYQAKIYFETVIFLLLTITGIYIALEQNEISRKQSELSSAQTDYIKKQTQSQLSSLPDIRVKYHNEITKDKGLFPKNDPSYIVVENYGGYTPNIIVYISTFYEISFSRKLHQKDQKKFYFVNSYSCFTPIGTSNKCEIFSSADKCKLEKCYNVINEYNKYLYDNNLYGLTRRQKFVRVSFSDSLGRYYSDCYLIDCMFGDIKYLSPKETEFIRKQEIMQSLNKQTQNIIHGQLTLETLLKDFNK